MFKTLLSRFADSPALVAEGQQMQFEACLNALAQHPDAQKLLDASMSSQNDDFWPEEGERSFRSFFRPYVVKDGILQIPVRGVLLNDFPWQIGTWATGYDYIWRAFSRGLSDDNVKAIAFLANSPGGEAAGNFDLVDRLFAARGQKPIRAFAYEHAYSAAYSITSSADQLSMSRTGGVGSIGVVMMHMDVSKAMDERGWKISFIAAPEDGHKTDGNPYEPLKPEVRARWQQRANTLYDLFVSTVARNRGMSEDDVRGTKALTFSADEAITNGLADTVAPFDDAMAAFAADLSINEGSETMSVTDKDKTAAPNAANEAALTDARSQGKTEGLAEGANTERARITAIISSEEGQKRPSMAVKMATGEKFAALDSETIIGMLADMPEEKVEASSQEDDSSQQNKQKFDTAMKTDTPNVGSDGGKSGDDDGDMNVLSLGRQFGIGGLRNKSA